MTESVLSIQTWNIGLNPANTFLTILGGLMTSCGDVTSSTQCRLLRCSLISRQTSQLLAVPDNTLWYLAILGNTWQYLAIPGNTWQYLSLLGNTWQYLAIPVNTCKYLTILLQHCPILNNTYQFLTIPNNTWQTWYQFVSPGSDKASSITARYHHNTDLMVFVCLVSSRYWFWEFLQNLWCSSPIIHYYNTFLWIFAFRFLGRPHLAGQMRIQYDSVCNCQLFVWQVLWRL